MKVIDVSTIAKTVAKLCIKANCHINDDVYNAIIKAYETEQSETGRAVLLDIVENARTADKEEMPICQDTGMAVFFIEIGQDVKIEGGLLNDAVNEGVKTGYEKGYLRKSVVNDPVFRKNTNDNTPAVIHYDIVQGDKLKIVMAPKGFGSENMSALKMLKPSEGIEGIKKFILETVIKAGPNPCPPVVVGAGIGGTMEKACILAKKALVRPIGEKSSIEHIRKLEEELLLKINKTGIGPAGLGGRNTALAVNINVFPTHIAGLPVAVNINCHATRHAEAVL